MGDENRPAIVESSHDAYPHSLAEKGYSLSDQARSDWEEYQKDVIGLVQRGTLKIWGRTLPETAVTGSAPHPRIIITASDLISRYLKWRYTSLFQKLWVDKPRGMNSNMVLIAEPHASYPHDWRGTFASDQVMVGIEPQGFKRFNLFVEDDTGLGVFFHNINPQDQYFTSPVTVFAYGPRDFAERISLINESWSNIGHRNPMILQALLVVNENIQDLTFKPIISHFPGDHSSAK